MFKNLRFCAEHIRINALDFVFKTIETAIAFLLISGLVTTSLNYRNYGDQINRLMREADLMTVNVLNSESNQYTNKNSDSVRRIYDMLRAIPSAVIVNNEYPVTINETYTERYQVTDNFFDSYGIHVTDQATDWKKKFRNYDPEKKYLLAGDFFKKKYDTGDFIDIQGESYQIIGFIKSGSSVALPMQDYQSECLDKAVVTPIYEGDFDETDLISYIRSVQVPSKEKKALYDVKRYNLNNEALELDISSCRDQMKKVRKATIEKEVYYGIIALVFIFFSVMSMICMILQMITDYGREYAINIMCGAQKKDIIIRIILEAGVMLSISLGVSLFEGINAGFAVDALVSILYIVMIVLITAFRIRYYSPGENLRSVE